MDSFLSLLGGTFKLRKDPFSDPDTHPLSSAVSILGALSSVSQLHCAKSHLLAKPTFLGSSDFPSQPHMHFACSGVTYSEEFSQAGIIWFARFALGIFQVFGQPEADDFQHAVEGFLRGSNSYKGIGGIEVGPVLEIRGRLQKLRGQGKSNRGKVGNAYKSMKR